MYTTRRRMFLNRLIPPEIPNKTLGIDEETKPLINRVYVPRPPIDEVVKASEVKGEVKTSGNNNYVGRAVVYD